MSVWKFFGIGTGLAGLLTGGLVVGAAIVPLRGAAPTERSELSEEASTALLQMGKTLLAEQFSFQAHLLRVYSDDGGRFLHIGHTLKLLVRRPDRVRIDEAGDDGTSQLFYDGKTVALFLPEKQKYLRMPMPNTIEAMLAEATGRKGFDFPLADFLAEAPNKAFLTGITEGKVVNTVTIDGVPCLHLTFSQPPRIELELWLEKTEQSLPRRLFITYRSIPGQPNFIAEFSDWDFSVAPTGADFTFQPPAGARQLELTAAASTVQGNGGTR
jgi:hypothetical protein